MTTTDRFSKQSASLDSPFYNGFAFAANSTNTFTILPRAIYVGGTGNIAFLPAGYNGESPATITLVGVPAGTVLNIRTALVYANSTVTNLVALY